MEIWEKVCWHVTLSARSVLRLLNLPILFPNLESIDHRRPFVVAFEEG